MPELSRLFSPFFWWTGFYPARCDQGGSVQISFVPISFPFLGAFLSRFAPIPQDFLIFPRRLRARSGWRFGRAISRDSGVSPHLFTPLVDCHLPLRIDDWQEAASYGILLNNVLLR